jgi:predicted RNA-binding Zn ribbon-like protein
VRLRALLRRLVTLAAGGEPLSREDLAELDEFVGAATFSRRLAVARDTVSVALEPVVRDWRWVLSELATSFAELVEANADGRLKLCANAECRWAFYDETKNRRRRWCGHASCGDLDKVRRFRERQRAARAAPA